MCRLEVVNLTAKNTSVDFDNLVKLYLNGESLDNLSRDFHTSVQFIKDTFAARGVKLRTNAEREAIKIQKRIARITANDPASFADIGPRYIAGESENALAKSYGVSRNVIRARLLKQGIEIRGYSAANLLKASKESPEERRANAAAAHEAVRGSTRSYESLVQAALTREGIVNRRSHAEILLNTWFIERGVVFTPQKAIGKYSVDFGAYPVAVEIFGGGWHFYKDHIERFNYLFDHGWNIVVIYVNGRISVLTPSAADYIISFLQETTSNPTAPRQYRVIWGEGKLYAGGSADANELASIVPLRTRDWAGSSN